MSPGKGLLPVRGSHRYKFQSIFFGALGLSGKSPGALGKRNEGSFLLTVGACVLTVEFPCLQPLK